MGEDANTARRYCRVVGVASNVYLDFMSTSLESRQRKCLAEVAHVASFAVDSYFELDAYIRCSDAQHQLERTPNGGLVRWRDDLEFGTHAVYTLDGGGFAHDVARWDMQRD